MTRRTQGVLGGRSEQVVQKVMKAAVAELAESGWRAFRIDAVAWAARVNKTTIYRRWPAKTELLGAAVLWLRQFVHDVPLADTGSLERDLLEAFRRRVQFKGRVEGRAWARLLAEKHDPEVAAAIGGEVRERSGEWYAIVTRAIARREIPVGTDAKLLFSMLSAIVDGWKARGERLQVAVRSVVAAAKAGTLVRH